jgi:DNA mismatch repair protein MutL
LLVVHQQLAHERIIYERLSKAMLGQAITTQRSLFPVTLEFTPADAVIISELLEDLLQLGYIIENFGKNTFVVQGIPADLKSGNEEAVLEKLIEQYKHFSSELNTTKRELLLRTLAWQQSVKSATPLSSKEMENLVRELFYCDQPNSSPSGKPTYMELKKDKIDFMFQK